MNFKDATPTEINKVMEDAYSAFLVYRSTSPEVKAVFLENIAENIIALGDELLLKASDETNIPVTRLLSERNRTTSQLYALAALLREGSWVEASIDTAVPDRKPTAKPDLRKMLVPLGPVVVFGASNFPFAYSTAGGDTASALAAGCPVVVKAHQAHAATSSLVATAISNAVETLNLPAAVFQHVHGSSFETGKALVQHPATAAVGFTGSFAGGRALYDYAHQRKIPIPVFSEMGSVNPAVFFPGSLQESGESLANAFASSITTGMGQFCTKPGVLFALEGEVTNQFFEMLSQKIKEATPARMLHSGIYEAYIKNAQKALVHAGKETALLPSSEETASPFITSVSGEAFIRNPSLHEEVFGPFAIMVLCHNPQQMMEAWMSLSGQLTTTFIGTDKDFNENLLMISRATDMAGRIVFNGVPTGVEVCASMEHGGPYPATTDGRFTAVGINAIKRWVRPVCYQNCPEALLPPELKSDNPLGIVRTLNGKLVTLPVDR